MSKLRHSRLAVAALFSLSLLYFLQRGPYRALRETRSGDLATVYAAARCWIHHENPYARPALTRELTDAGAPAALIREQDRHASLYLISAMPLVALIAWLPWLAANVAWCFLSIGLFAASVWVLLARLNVSPDGKWVAASVCLFFSPTYVGVLNGNPSVIAISAAILSIDFALRNRLWASALFFASALCLKPQIALCSLLCFLLWKRWRIVFTGLSVAILISVVAVLQVSALGQKWAWWNSLRQNIASESAPGGLTDPTPSSPYAPQLLNAQTLSTLVTTNRIFAEGLVLAAVAGLTIFYIYWRKRNKNPDPRMDFGFLAAATLAATYHRYYDGELLLLSIPAMVYLWRIRQRGLAWILAVCFAALAFPLQSIFARALGPAATRVSPEQLLLLRHQPAAILVVLVVLSLSQSR